ncbi:hypothetical protein [Chitinophaga filiformis]|uniref:Uncharacterized protein n=1 Tax=Chitinophaga filiformis TaxID=104663 RepID=A0ABY4HX23_CHIFI|nr:hypothetical protein [Chitinophaga filiformis]UPK67978.1 hypothetical protein MYF79_23785 [Chitinophaga filiformis]
MKLFYFVGLCFALTVSLTHYSFAQDSLLNIPNKYVDQLTKKANRATRRIDASTQKAMAALMKQQSKLYKEVQKINPEQASQLFQKSMDSLVVLKKAMRLKSLQLPGAAKQFVPYLDSSQTTLKFLNEHKAFLQNGKGSLEGAIGKVATLQQSINNAAQIQQYLKSQKDAIKAQLSAYSNLTKDLTKLNKTAYYYSQQVCEYKAMLSDKKKAEKKALELLSKYKPYSTFMQRNSMLADLFNFPGGNGAQQLEGLQTRTAVEQTIQQHIGTSPEAKKAVSELMDKAQQEFATYKSRLPDLNSAADMPDFKPNPMKGKTFLRRLEVGGNIQFKKSSTYFPSNTELAVQVAYKLNNKSSAGLGASYAFGMGTGWDHIKFSHHALGIRSFMDWKLKGSFFFNGGFEGRYITAIRDFNDVKAWNKWQPAALLGISKKYKVNSKIKGNVQLLYDFLATHQSPRQSPLIIRFGYSK